MVTARVGSSCGGGGCGGSAPVALAVHQVVYEHLDEVLAAGGRQVRHVGLELAAGQSLLALSRDVEDERGVECPHDGVRLFFAGPWLAGPQAGSGSFHATVPLCLDELYGISQMLCW